MNYRARVFSGVTPFGERYWICHVNNLNRPPGLQAELSSICGSWAAAMVRTYEYMNTREAIDQDRRRGESRDRGASMRQPEAPLRIWYYRRWCWLCRLCPQPELGYNLPSWEAACVEAEIHFSLCHSAAAVMCHDEAPPP